MSQNINIQNNTGTVNIYNSEEKDKKHKTINIAAIDKYSSPLSAELDFSPWGKDMFRVSILVKNSLIGQVLQQNYLTYNKEEKAIEIFNKVSEEFDGFKKMAEEGLMHSSILVPKIWHKMAEYEKTSELSSPDSDSIKKRYDNPEIHDDFQGGRPRGLVIHPVETHFPEHNGIVKKASKEKEQLSWYKTSQINEDPTDSNIFDKLNQIAEQNGLKLYAVGGFVRDSMMNKEPKDIDIMADIENKELAGQKANEILSQISENKNSIINFVSRLIPGGKKITEAEMFVEEDKIKPCFIPLKFKITYQDHSKKSKPIVRDEIVETTINPSMIIANAFGNKVPRGESFGIYAIKTEIGEIEIAYPRTESYDLGSRKPRVGMGTLSEDANRRDFGMNALYMDLKTKEIKDPTGHGIQDIKEKKIRITDESSMDTIFKDDPLRILRAFRFSSKLGFEIDPMIIEYVKKNPELMAMKGNEVHEDQDTFEPKLSAERIRDEFLKIMSSKECYKTLKQMKDIGILKYIIPLPDEAQPWELEQINPHHFENVWDHTINVMKSYEEVLNSYGIDDPEQKMMGNLVCLLHDTGKLIPEKGFQDKEKKDGKVTRRTFVGHQDESAKISETILKRLKFTSNNINSIVKMVKHHDKVLDLSTKNVPALIRFLKDVGPEYKNLLLMAMGDRKAHIEGHNNYDYLKEIYQNMSENEEQYYNRIDSWVDGGTIMSYTGAQGELVGKIKKLISDLQIDGDIQSRDQIYLALECHKNIAESLRIPINEIETNLLYSIFKNPPYENYKDWIIKNNNKVKRINNKPLIEPLLNGEEIMSLGFRGKQIGEMKNLIVEKMILGEINSKEEAVLSISEFSPEIKESQGTKILKFSEYNSGLFLIDDNEEEKTIETKIKEILPILKSKNINTKEIKNIINDQEWYDKLIILLNNYNIEEVIDLYEEILEEFESEDILEFGKQLSKAAQLNMETLPEKTQYGDVQEGVQGPNGTTIAGWSGKENLAIAALNLINETSFSGVVSNVWIGTSSGAEHLGVYESAFEGQGFRVNLEKVHEETTNLMSEIQLDIERFQSGLENGIYGEHKDYIDSQFGGPNMVFEQTDVTSFIAGAEEDIQILVIAEVMVHEMTHAQGAEDEGQPVSAEKAFLAEGIRIVNEKRKQKSMLPLPIGIKGQ